MCMNLQVIQIVALVIYGLILILWPLVDERGMIHDWFGYSYNDNNIDYGEFCVLCMHVC
jgi:hypothetical protein